jgi:hypothetical protein
MSHEDDALGTTIAGRYRVEALLGRGGMGSVYRVRDLNDARALALKRAYAPDAGLLRRRRTQLELEYHTLVQLAHPHIIEVYDFGVDEQGPFYTMELLDGADLQDGGPLSWQAACSVLRDVASSLAILHARGFVHRDLSAHNVRCTSDGRAKLLDFGAMTAMGVNASVVGTPPFLCPEALQMQALDARADLYALGALGYRILSGRHAYPARTLSDLRDTWRSVPVPLTRLGVALPAALDTLIMQLLALDRGARPQTAAEVMARVCAIAGLPIEEQAEVGSAYLTTPTLLGRDAALLQVRYRMLALARGDGATLLVEGASGSGRSRLLDACALEAKLIGAIVVRADQRDSASGDWGVVRALMSRLHELLPEDVTDATRLSRRALAQLVFDLPSAEPAQPAHETQRSALIRELRDVLLAIANKRRVLLVVDDADRIDEPSAAVLAALSHNTERHALVLALSVESRREPLPSSALRVLGTNAERVLLEDLDATQSEALLRSVFGDVTNLPYVAARVHALARGNPRATMELAQHLVDRALARYAAGNWALPARLDDHDLPDSLANSLRRRLETLTGPALALVQTLAACDEDAFQVSDFARLSAQPDRAQLFTALDELVSARILIAATDTYVFRQRGFLPVLASQTPTEQLRAIHGRCADLLTERGGELERRAHHLLAAGRVREAVELLCSLPIDENLPALPLLERALLAAQSEQLPARAILQLRSAVLTKAPYVLAFESFRREWPAVMSCLAAASGLADYAANQSMPEAERLKYALEAAQARHDTATEHDRTHGVFASLSQLGALYANGASFGMATIDRAFLESLPDLSAFRPLSAAFGFVIDMLAAAKHWVCGRHQLARTMYAQLIQRIEADDHAGLDESQQRRALAGLRFLVSQVDANAGIPIEDRAQLIEREPTLRASAWQLRQVYSLSQGDLEGARTCMRRAELLRLQEGSEQYLVGMTSTVELLAANATEDLHGINTALAAIALLAEHAPGWQPLLALARSHQRRLHGDNSGALQAVLTGLELARPGQHLAYLMLASAHVDLLTRTGEVEAALAQGFRYLEQAEHQQLIAADSGLQLALARALAQSGRLPEAEQRLDAQIAQAESLGHSGVVLGTFYEERARCALALQDRAGFERFAERCAVQYRKGNQPVLNERFSRLLEQAGTQGGALLSLRPGPAQLSARAQAAQYAALQRRMRECLDDAERARCALTLLLQHLESFTGFLYRCEAAGPNLQLRQLASIPEDAADAGLIDWLASWATAAQHATDEPTITRDVHSERTVTGAEPEGELHYVDAHGSHFAAALLELEDRSARCVAVLAFRVPASGRRAPDRGLTGTLAEELDRLRA